MSVYAGISAKEDRGARLALRITLFTISYFLLWALFSVTAAIVQMALRGSALFRMGGTLATPVMAGVLAIVAGVYQFTTIKHVCLKHCRHPLHYLLQHWKPGLAGRAAFHPDHADGDRSSLDLLGGSRRGRRQRRGGQPGSQSRPNRRR